MDLQAIEARLRANEAGRDGELYEHAPADMRALIGEVCELRQELEAVKRIHTPEVVQVSTANEAMIDLCWCCKETHPCPTLQALGVEE